MNRLSAISVLTLTAVIAAACGSSSTTPAPAASASGPSHAASAAASSAASTPGASAPAASAVASAPASAPASVAVVGSIPDDLLLFPGKLVVCSDLPYPPQEYFDDNGNPIGSDIEIAQGIAARLGLTAQIENSFFDTIIPALTGGKCDIIVSAQNINDERLAQVDMIPYFQAGQAFMVQKGNPANLQAQTDLCGKKVAVETGTTMLDFLKGTSSYKGGGMPKICKDAGLDPVQATPFPKDSDALQALQAGAADAYFADLPVVIGYVEAQPDAFEVSPVPQIDPALEGISVGKSTDPAQEHTAIYDAVKTALLAMMSDGSYQAILAKYKVDPGAITPDVVNTPQTPAS